MRVVVPLRSPNGTTSQRSTQRPDFSRAGIEAAKEVRKLHPGTGVAILSQFDHPDYAVSLLSEGAAGYAYLLKDRVGEGDPVATAWAKGSQVPAVGSATTIAPA